MPSSASPGFVSAPHSHAGRASRVLQISAVLLPRLLPAPPPAPPLTTTWCSSCRRWAGKCRAAEYDSCMKRITVSLPDELVERIKRAAGGKRQVSSYVATALEDYQERETLDDILAAWREETPVPEEVQRQVEAELDNAGLTGLADGGGRLAG